MPLIEENPSLLSYQRQRLRRMLRRKRTFDRYDQDIKSVFPGSQPTLEGFSAVVDYLWRAYEHYVDDWGTIAYYPGWPSIYGAASDGVEGVSRTMPLWAAFATSPIAEEPDIQRKMFEAIRRALLNGTSPELRGYWGNIGDRSTLICEAADIALSVWLIKDTLLVRIFPKRARSGAELACPGRRQEDGRQQLAPFRRLGGRRCSRPGPATPVHQS